MDQTDRPLFALFLRIVAIIFISTMFMLVKLLGERGIAAPEIMFWRQGITVPLLLGWLAATGGLGRLRTLRMASHAMRAAVGMAALFCNFMAMIYLPLAVATTLGFTTPLFAVILTATVLRDRVGPWRWTAVALGFVGVLIIAQPGGGSLSLLGTAAGISAGLLVAIVSFQIRDLARTEDSITCVFYFALFGAMMTALFLPVYAQRHTPAEWLLLGAVGLVGTLGQLLITVSLRFGSVASVIVMDYTSLIWATLFGWLIWDTLPPAATWLGAPAIIASGLIVAWREQRLARTLSPPAALEVDQSRPN